MTENVIITSHKYIMKRVNPSYGEPRMLQYHHVNIMPACALAPGGARWEGHCAVQFGAIIMWSIFSKILTIATP